MRGSKLSLIFFLVVCTTIGCSASAPSNSRRLASNTSIRAAWDPSQFTAPAQHNPNHFRYIVHTIDTFGAAHSAHDSYDFINSTIANNPNASLSVSIIDQDKRKVFGAVGFILNVPAENILFASSTDLGSENLDKNTDPSKLDRELAFLIRFKGGLKTPDEILADTTSYNEVLVRGKENAGISIIGVLIVRQPEYRNPSLPNELKRLSIEKNLPLVYLDPPN